MCAHPLHTALQVGGDALRQAADLLSHHPLSTDSLRCAVRQTRQLTAELAALTDTLADHAETLPVFETPADQRPGSAPVETMREIVEDLRTTARHLNTSHLLLEPADDDLAHLRPQISAPVTPTRLDGHRRHPYADDRPTSRHLGIGAGQASTFRTRQRDRPDAAPDEPGAALLGVMPVETRNVRVLDADRPAPLERLDATTEAVGGLQEIAAAEELLDDVLARVAATSARAIPDADAATITVLTGEQPRTAVWTDERMVDIDTQQYASGRGPCLDSARSRRTIRTVVSEAHQNWPEFSATARRAGIRASLSAPLLVAAPEDNQELVGSLNIYSRTAAAFDPFDEALLQLYTTAAAAAIINGRRWQHFREKINHLETALTSRAEIDQAKGVLMALHGCTADEAFARLVEQSQRTNVRVAKLAHDLLASLRTHSGPATRCPQAVHGAPALPRPAQGKPG